MAANKPGVFIQTCTFDRSNDEVSVYEGVTAWQENDMNLYEMLVCTNICGFAIAVAGATNFMGGFWWGVAGFFGGAAFGIGSLVLYALAAEFITARSYRHTRRPNKRTYWR